MRTLFVAVCVFFRGLLIPKATLAIENAALRQQLAVYIKNQKRPRLKPCDRAFWLILRRVWSDWARPLVVVKPATVIGWHKKGFLALWRAKCERTPGAIQPHLERRCSGPLHLSWHRAHPTCRLFFCRVLQSSPPVAGDSRDSGPLPRVDRGAAGERRVRRSASARWAATRLSAVSVVDNSASCNVVSVSRGHACAGMVRSVNPAPTVSYAVGIPLPPNSTSASHGGNSSCSSGGKRVFAEYGDARHPGHSLERVTQKILYGFES